MTDLLTQLRDYGRQIESDLAPGTALPLVVDDETRPRRTPERARRWAWVPIGAAAVLLAVLPLLLLLGRLDRDPQPPTILAADDANGWVAFPVRSDDGDHDIYLAGLGRPAFPVTGSDPDGPDEQCPAFSPDGTRLAYGQAEGTSDTGHADSTLIVADVEPHGSLAEAFRVQMGPRSAPPCPTWSPAGDRIAVGVRNSADWHTPGDIWIVSTDDGAATVLEDRYVSHNPPVSFLYSDMEWSPDGTELAVSGQDGISLYSAAHGSWRSLPGTRGARTLTWSPDGTRIAYEFAVDDRPGEIRVAEVDGTRNYLLAGDYEALHGIGPVWSPTGDWIVYQRVCDGFPSEISPHQPCRERHEVVVVTPDGSETVLPHLRLPGADEILWPSRVTWSPDGTHLLYRAQAETAPNDALIAVPLDPASAPIVLYEGPIAGYDDGYQLASQVWGRQPQAPSN